MRTTRGGQARVMTHTESPVRQRAVVTGASSGIGRELARQLAAHDFDLVVAAEDDDIEHVAQELRGSGVAVQAVRVDLARRDGVDELWSVVEGDARPLDVAVINAGVGVGGPFAETSLDDHLRLVDLNVGHTVHLAKHVVDRMVGQGSGRILITSSIAASAPAPYQATYGASKSFVQSFAEGLRRELDPHGVSVTALQPGPTDTEFFVRADMEDTKVGAGPKDDPAEVAREGFEAMMRGEDHVVTGGASNSVQATVGSVVPDRLGARMQERQTKPGSAKD
jgi:short-subunit dehydrogenase